MFRDTWYPLNEEDLEVYMYSAWYDDREAGGVLPYVRVIAVGDIMKQDIYCHLWFTGVNHPQTIQGTLTKHGRGHVIEGKLLHQYFISCVLHDGKHVPSHVTISTTKCQPIRNMVPVMVPEQEKEGEYEHQFGICVPVTFWNIDPYR